MLPGPAQWVGLSHGHHIITGQRIIVAQVMEKGKEAEGMRNEALYMYTSLYFNLSLSSLLSQVA